MTDLQTPRPPGWVPDVATFGARLALLRQAMGWTNVKEAANACSIGPENWRRWESGKFEPRGLVSACMKIAGVTGVDYRWLALGPDNRQVEAVPVPTEGSTLRYPALGEHVVAVGTGDPRPNLSNMRSNVRTRPIDGVRPDRTVLR
jgi:transcriptional regulator with XRE-family HTH domain